MSPEDSYAQAPIDDQVSSDAALREKLTDALTPGYQVEFDPEEAEMAGAFLDDALSEADAIESEIDLVDVWMAASSGAPAIGKE